jgi:hypothetical protein
MNFAPSRIDRNTTRQRLLVPRTSPNVVHDIISIADYRIYLLHLGYDLSDPIDQTAGWLNSTQRISFSC